MNARRSNVFCTARSSMDPSSLVMLSFGGVCAVVVGTGSGALTGSSWPPHAGARTAAKARSGRNVYFAMIIP